MKKILIAVMFLGMCSVAQADISVSGIADNVKKLPLRQGAVYSLKDSEFSHSSSAVLFEKWNVGVEAGYIDNGKVMGSISYKLLDLKDYISTPLLKEISFRPGAYVAFDEINDEVKVDYGVSFTLLTLKW